MNDDEEDGGGEEEGEDAEDDDEGEDVPAEAQALRLAHSVLAALREAVRSCTAALPRVSEAGGGGAVGRGLAVEAEGERGNGVEGHLTAAAMAMVREGTGGTQGQVDWLAGD